jgi:nicotinate-nucleotide adenylyltransferase
MFDPAAPTDPPRPRRIGIFGGSFDPPHLGHLILASELHEALALDEVRWLVSPTPPHKRDRVLAPDADRVAMVQAAIAGDPRFVYDPIEFERPGPSFTVDTLAALQERHPGATLVFLMGGDSLRDLPTWRDPAGIARLAEIGVAARPGVVPDLAALEAQVPALRGRVRVVETTGVDISSTAIRARVAAGRTIRPYVPAAVADVIDARGLYRP